MRKPKIYWGSEFPYRIIGFSDDTAELQKIDADHKWIAVYKDKEEDLVLSNLSWLSGCKGRIHGYRKI